MLELYSAEEESPVLILLVGMQNFDSHVCDSYANGHFEVSA